MDAFAVNEAKQSTPLRARFLTSKVLERRPAAGLPNGERKGKRLQ
jgi:hypothetical protein